MAESTPPRALWLLAIAGGFVASLVLAALLTLPATGRAQTTDALERYDADGNGAIEEGELRKAADDYHSR